MAQPKTRPEKKVVRTSIDRLGIAQGLFWSAPQREDQVANLGFFLSDDGFRLNLNTAHFLGAEPLMPQ
jgi:hypothetical protein